MTSGWSEFLRARTDGAVCWAGITIPPSPSSAPRLPAVRPILAVWLPRGEVRAERRRQVGSARRSARDARRCGGRPILMIKARGKTRQISRNRLAAAAWLTGTPSVSLAGSGALSVRSARRGAAARAVRRPVGAAGRARRVGGGRSAGGAVRPAGDGLVVGEARVGRRRGDRTACRVRTEPDAPGRPRATDGAPCASSAGSRRRGDRRPGRGGGCGGRHGHGRARGHSMAGLSSAPAWWWR